MLNLLAYYHTSNASSSSVTAMKSNLQCTYFLATTTVCYIL